MPGEQPCGRVAGKQPDSGENQGRDPEMASDIAARVKVLPHDLRLGFQFDRPPVELIALFDGAAFEIVD